MNQPITLYIDLADGRKADLEAISRAAIHFSDLVKEIAFQFDPSASIRLDLDSGTEGSLKLNTMLNGIKEQLVDPKTYFAILIGVATHFSGAITDSVTSEIVEDVKSAFIEEETTLSEADLDAIAKRVQGSVCDGAGKKQSEEFFKSLEADDAITGVGISPRFNSRPEHLVQKFEFRERYSSSEVTEKKIRTTSEVKDLVLIAPVLLASERKWKFKGEGPEFGAVIKDFDFLNAVVSGRYHLEMKGGIIMTVEIETVEVNKGEVWEIKERNITKVISAKGGSEQLVMSISL